MKITDKQRLDVVAKFTQFNPFVIKVGEDPRKVIDATIRAGRKLRKPAAVLMAFCLIGCAMAKQYSFVWGTKDSQWALFNLYVVSPTATNVIVCTMTNVGGVDVPSGAYVYVTEVDSAGFESEPSNILTNTATAPVSLKKK